MDPEPLLRQCSEARPFRDIVRQYDGVHGIVFEDFGSSGALELTAEARISQLLETDQVMRRGRAGSKDARSQQSEREGSRARPLAYELGGNRGTPAERRRVSIETSMRSGVEDMRHLWQTLAKNGAHQQC